MDIKFFNGPDLPVDRFKPMIVQPIDLEAPAARLAAIREAGFNTFLLKTKHVFLDMLTDSGTNAMSTNQLAAMMQADEAYAGSRSFERLETSVRNLFGMDLFLPVHQGRAAEHIISRTFVRPGQIVPMNFHFTTTRAHIELAGGRVEELIVDDAYNVQSDVAFKGNMDTDKLESSIRKHGRERIAFIRMEVATNLTGGQPVSIQNLRAVKRIAEAHGLMLVIDMCLVAENAWFIKQREPGWHDKPIGEIIRTIASLADIIYFSARKLGSARGGGIVVREKAVFDRMRELVPLFEGFFTYGGMSTREIEALAVGLRECCDDGVVRQMPEMIACAAQKLTKAGIPVVTPPGALGVHLDAQAFLPHVSQKNYTAGSLAAAIFIASGVRGMERGTISTDRDPDTREERLADLELVRLAFPRRTITLSQLEFLVDRIAWLFHHRNLVGGLTFTEEPKVLRFFSGRLTPIGGWDKKLTMQFAHDFGSGI